MKTGALLLVLATVPALHGEQLTAAQAKDHEGETATVCGEVAGEHTASGSRGKPTFINLDAPYPRQIFTVLIWDDDRSAIGELPRPSSHICVTGKITDYRGVPEIVVRLREQIK